MPGTVDTVAAKLQMLTHEQLAQLDAFLTQFQSASTDQREIMYASAAARLSEPAFAAVWNNPEDDAYDEL